jgi:hypothetical protein
VNFYSPIATTCYSHDSPRIPSHSEVVNQFQRDRLAGREQGRRRVNQVTRATVATSTVGVALIATLFAQAPASATNATTVPTLTSPGLRPESGPSSAGAGSSSAGAGTSQHHSRHRRSVAPTLQPPSAAPVQSSGTSSHALSGGS